MGASSYRLADLNKKKIGPYTIKLELLGPAKVAWWQRFDLYLETKHNAISQGPVLGNGIYSNRKKELGLGSWMEIDYYPSVTFIDGKVLDLSQTGIDLKLLKLLYPLIDSHIMVSYVIWGYEHPFLKETQKGLLEGIPEVATPLGFLLFKVGFWGFKDWYYAEGWREGSVKLQGLKIQDQKHRHQKIRELRGIVTQFLTQNPNSQSELQMAARPRALELLHHLSALPYQA
jgi:hypothetical protein